MKIRTTIAVPLMLFFFSLFLFSCSGNDQGVDDAGQDQVDTDGGTGGDADADVDSGFDPGGPYPLHGACDPEARVGLFEVVYNASEAYVSGSVGDSVMPGTTMEQLMEAGPCRLFRKVIPFCDPSCENGTVCDQDGTCAPYPVNQDVGAVLVEGLSKTIELKPTDVSNLYFDTSLPNPPFEAGDWIRLSAAGGAVPGFKLYGQGIGLLERPDDGWVLKRDQPLTLRWTPGMVEGAIVSATVSVDQHGTTPASIECESADTGAFEIPADMVNGLLDQGVSGAPAGILARRSLDSVETDLGCVEFRVSTSIASPVSLEGGK